MKRLVTLPGPIAIIDSNTGEEAEDGKGGKIRWTHVHIVRQLLTGALARRKIDTFDHVLLVGKLSVAGPTTVSLEEDLYELLRATVKIEAGKDKDTTPTMNDSVRSSPAVVDFFRGILDAPDADQGNTAQDRVKEE